MPAHKLGAAAKRRVASVRLTEAQHQRLVKRYGSVSKAMRAMVIDVLEDKEKEHAQDD